MTSGHRPRGAARAGARSVGSGFYNGTMHRGLLAGLVLALAATSALAQTPQPFPRPGSQPAQPQAPPPAAPSQTAPAPAPAATPAIPASAPAGAPDPAVLGVPLYPTAVFLTSYDAGRGQRYYLYGVTASFAELVTFYRTQLRERGNLVFEDPPMHMFEVGRFRDETMAFPPGITVKDWTFGGSQGYPNPRPGTGPARFPTVLMVVPPPPPTTTR